MSLSLVAAVLKSMGDDRQTPNPTCGLIPSEEMPADDENTLHTG